MIVLAENEYEGQDLDSILSFDWEETAEEVARQVLKDEGCPYQAEVNLLLIGSDRMREINRSERDVDRTTDVLSFPCVNYHVPAAWEDAEASISDNFDPETGRLMLGDILINVKKVEEQADQYGHSTRREFAFLVAHSLFHLLGYDHMAAEEETVMFRKQDRVLRELGITRD